MIPALSLTWLAGYRFRPFQVETSVIDFHYSRRVAGTNLDGCKGSNISAVWTPGHQETLINGVLQGRKQTDRMGASALSRMQIWDLLLDTVGLINVAAMRNVLKSSSYPDMKRSQDLEQRRRVKEDVKREALKDWNNGSSDGFLEKLCDLEKSRIVSLNTEMPTNFHALEARNCEMSAMLRAESKGYSSN